MLRTPAMVHVPWQMSKKAQKSVKFEVWEKTPDGNTLILEMLKNTLYDK